jgi:hypothetical protein
MPSKPLFILEKTKAANFLIYRKNSDTKSQDPAYLWHWRCCQFAFVFDKLSSRIKMEPMGRPIVPKPNAFVKVADASANLALPMVHQEQ